MTFPLLVASSFSCENLLNHYFSWCSLSQCCGSIITILTILFVFVGFFICREFVYWSPCSSYQHDFPVPTRYNNYMLTNEEEFSFGGIVVFNRLNYYESLSRQFFFVEWHSTLAGVEVYEWLSLREDLLQVLLAAKIYFVRHLHIVYIGEHLIMHTQC